MYGDEKADGDESVRVELDHHAPSPEDDGSPSDSHGRRSTVLITGIALVSVIATALLLRPPEGQTAAGTPRTTVPDTAESTPTEPHVEAQDVGSFPVVGLDVRRVDSMAESNGRHLALIHGDASEAAPLLLASADGITWDSVEPTLTGPASVDVSASARFSHLRSTPEGFALLMWSLTTEAVDEEVGESTRVVPRRTFGSLRQLVSNDGVRWRSRTAEPIVADHERSQRFIAFHGDNHVVLAHWRPSPWQAELLAKAVRPGLVPSDACDVRWEASRLIVFPCDDTTSSILEADDLVDAERYDSFRACGDSLRWVPSVSYTIAHLDAGVVGTLDDPTLSPGSWSSHGDDLLVVDAGDTFASEVVDACAGIVDIEFPEPSILRLTPGGETGRLPLATVDGAGVLGTLFSHGGEITQWVDDELLVLDEGARQWRTALAAPTAAPRTSLARRSSGGDVVALLGPGQVWIGRVSTGEWATAAIRELTDERDVVHVDDSVVLVADSWEARAIPTPGTDASS